MRISPAFLGILKFQNISLDRVEDHAEKFTIEESLVSTTHVAFVVPLLVVLCLAV